MGNVINFNILEMADHRVKRSQMWDLGGGGVLMDQAWSTFDLAAFKVICVSFGALTTFWKYDFQNATSSKFYTYDSFLTKLLICVPCDIAHKNYNYFLEFRYSKRENELAK